MADEEKLPILERLTWTATAIKDESGRYDISGVRYNITEEGLFMGTPQQRLDYLGTLREVFTRDVANNPEKTTCQIKINFERRGSGN